MCSRCHGPARLHARADGTRERDGSGVLAKRTKTPLTFRSSVRRRDISRRLVVGRMLVPAR